MKFKAPATARRATLNTSTQTTDGYTVTTGLSPLSNNQGVLDCVEISKDGLVLLFAMYKGGSTGHGKARQEAAKKVAELVAVTPSAADANEAAIAQAIVETDAYTASPETGEAVIAPLTVELRQRLLDNGLDAEVRIAVARDTAAAEAEAQNLFWYIGGALSGTADQLRQKLGDLFPCVRVLALDVIAQKTFALGWYAQASAALYSLAAYPAQVGLDPEAAKNPKALAAFLNQPGALPDDAVNGWDVMGLDALEYVAAQQIASLTPRDQDAIDAAAEVDAEIAQDAQDAQTSVVYGFGQMIDFIKRDSRRSRPAQPSLAQLIAEPTRWRWVIGSGFLPVQPATV